MSWGSFEYVSKIQLLIQTFRPSSFSPIVRTDFSSQLLNYNDESNSPLLKQLHHIHSKPHNLPPRLHSRHNHPRLHLSPHLHSTPSMAFIKQLRKRRIQEENYSCCFFLSYGRHLSLWFDWEFIKFPPIRQHQWWGRYSRREIYGSSGYRWHEAFSLDVWWRNLEFFRLCGRFFFILLRKKMIELWQRIIGWHLALTPEEREMLLYGGRILLFPGNWFVFRYSPEIE